VWLLVASVAIGGTGIAAMHYFGMAAVSMHGTVQYNLRLVGISVLIAIVTCAAALAAGLRVRGVWSSLGVSIVMGVAITGMHYTGMAAMRVYAGGSGLVRPGEPSSSLLLPLLLGASVVMFLLMLIVAMSPNEGRDPRRREPDPAPAGGSIAGGPREHQPPAGVPPR
jgi:NO-binding membrane sensor protein with MHYT domain